MPGSGPMKNFSDTVTCPFFFWTTLNFLLPAHHTLHTSAATLDDDESSFGSPPRKAHKKSLDDAPTLNLPHSDRSSPAKRYQGKGLNNRLPTVPEDPFRSLVPTQATPSPPPFRIPAPSPNDLHTSLSADGDSPTSSLANSRPPVDNEYGAGDSADGRDPASQKKSASPEQQPSDDEMDIAPPPCLCPPYPRRLARRHPRPQG
ncbi:hypothetical protein C8J57DRAFT_764477 [Mycena rebaudengoi]|nr:hypothetical protein C8J57DRAFT_764477 [Mycena rebaudengoi]